MKILDWPPNYVARCPVTLFEAATGSNSWHLSGTVGELHMKPLGNAMINFQLHDLLDNQVLFDYTMQKPDGFIFLAERFFAIRLENGSFRGFGFTDKAAANEMKGRVQEAIKPFCINELISADEPSGKHLHMFQDAPKSSAIKSKSLDIVSYESIPRRTLPREASFHKKEQSDSSIPSLEVASFSSTLKVNKFRMRWKLLLKGFAAISQIFGLREHEIEIGYPTDVKHVAHIGWDGPSVNGPSWMDEIRPAPDFSAAPLRDFGQPKRPEWIYDALSAANWTSQGLLEKSGLPPSPPQEFKEKKDKDPVMMGLGRHKKSCKDAPPKQNSRSPSQQQIYQI